ncbi:hypothetical protein EDB80DRAFT_704275 [Ilyonectria destructans]|nr:hypothetical protein EDB80DRAFT_704275 [Ilyonectria destructans]
MNGPSPNKPPTQKRLACDRCHARKLRCLTKTSTTRCSRCMHDGFPCTYSPPLKSGRPRKASLAVDNRSCQGQRGGTSPSEESSLLSGTRSESISSSITAPLPDMTQFDAACDLSYLAPDSDFLCHMDLTGGLASSSLPSTYPATLDSSSWLDSLIHNEQLIIPDQSPEKAPKGCSRGANGDHDTGSPVFNQLEPMVSIDSCASDGISDLVQTLCRLQQELAQLRRPSRGDGGGSSTMPPCQTSSNPVDAILRPGQELVDTVRQLFDECAKDRSAESRWRLSWDRRTLLPLVFTPLSLLLSTYGDMLQEVTTVRPQSRHAAGPIDHDRPGAKPSFIATSSGARECGQYQRQHHDRSFALPPSPSSVSPVSHQPSTLIPGNFNLSLGEMSLDRPLQLIIVTTVIKHHLAHLEHALHVYEKFHMHECELSPSEGFILSALAEIRSYARLLISETSKIVQ